MALDPKEHIKVGMPVIIKGNAFNRGKRDESVILEVGYYPSMWLPRGQKRWGATLEYDTMFINPDFDAGVPGAPEEIPGKAESSPMLEDQFSFNEETQQWEIQLR